MLTLTVLSFFLVSDRDFAALAVKSPALEERKETKQVQKDARFERFINVSTWRLIVVSGASLGWQL